MRIEIVPPVVTSLRRLSGVDRALPLIGRTIAERYLIEGILGRGATSIVCRAIRLEDLTPIAIKVLAPMTTDFVDGAVADRFSFEAQVLSELHHPNIVSVFDSGTTADGLVYTVMEFLEGDSLRTLLSLRDRLDPAEAVRIASAIAEGLDALHGRGLVHRDVKPANVFVGRDANGVEVVKLLDLGLARAFDGVESTNPPSDADGPLSETRPRRRMSTEDGFIVGTGPYMSPEQIQGMELDARSDVYALGVVTYRMLTGTLPFVGSDLPHLLSLHLSDPVESMLERAPSADLSPALDSVVLRALNKEPLARPSSVLDFARELHAALMPKTSELPLAMDIAPPISPRRQCIARNIAIGAVLFSALLASYAVTVRALRHAVPAQPRAVVSAAPPHSERWHVDVGAAVLAPEPAPVLAASIARVARAARVPIGPPAAPAATAATGHALSPHRPGVPEAPPPRAAAPLDDLKVPAWKSVSATPRAGSAVAGTRGE